MAWHIIIYFVFNPNLQGLAHIYVIIDTKLGEWEWIHILRTLKKSQTLIFHVLPKCIKSQSYQVPTNYSGQFGLVFIIQDAVGIFCN